MGEDMTYATEPTRAQLAARVAELERENASLRNSLAYWKDYGKTHYRMWVEAETLRQTEQADVINENAELRARLVIRDELADAVRAIYKDVPVSNWTRKPLRVIRDWLRSVGKQVPL